MMRKALLLLFVFTLIAFASTRTASAAYPIHNATASGNMEEVIMLLESGVDPDMLTLDGYSPLMQAAWLGNLSMAKLLLSYGADINLKNPVDGYTPLQLAVNFNQPHLAQFLLEAGADMNLKGAKNRSALEYAVDYKLNNMLAIFYKAGVVPSYTGNKNADLWTAFLAEDHDKAVSLLEKGANPNLKDKDAKSLLMYAVEKNWPQVAARLLEKKANHKLRDKDGFTAQMHAALQNQKELLEVFAAAGVEPPYTRRPKDDLLIGVLFSDRDKVREQLEKGGDVNSCYRFNSPLLNYSINRDDLETTKLLLAHKANPNVFNNYGYSPALIAIEKNNREILKLLLANGADPNQTNSWGVNPLMFALNRGRKELSRDLLPLTKNVNARVPLFGYSALFYAAAGGDLEMVKALLERGAQPDPATVIVAEGRHFEFKNEGFPEIAALFKADVLRRQMLRAQAAVEAAQSPEDYVKAVAEYKLAMDVDPNLPEIYYNLGLVQDKAGHYQSAIRNLRKYLELAPAASDRQAVQDLIYKLEYKRDTAGK